MTVPMANWALGSPRAKYAALAGSTGATPWSMALLSGSGWDLAAAKASSGRVAPQALKAMAVKVAPMV